MTLTVRPYGGTPPQPNRFMTDPAGRALLLAEFRRLGPERERLVYWRRGVRREAGMHHAVTGTIRIVGIARDHTPEKRRTGCEGLALLRNGVAGAVMQLHYFALRGPRITAGGSGTASSVAITSTAQRIQTMCEQRSLAFVYLALSCGLVELTQSTA